MKPYSDLYPNADSALPETNLVSERVVVLPTGPTMSVDMIRTVVSVIRIMLEQRA